MPQIVKSKFRFKIGDNILYNNKKYKILVYYFMESFNNYRHAYGYTLKIGKGGHNGARYSYDANGNHISFKEENKENKNQNQIKTSKIISKKINNNKKI